MKRLCYFAEAHPSWNRAARDVCRVLSETHTLVTESPEVVVVHAHPSVLLERARSLPRGATRIAYSVRETNKLTPLEIAGLAEYDEIWTCSRFCQSVFAQYHSRVRLVPHAAGTELQPNTLDRALVARDLGEDGVVRFLHVTNTNDPMKNTKLVVDAFLRLRARLPNAELVLKCAPGFAAYCGPYVRTIEHRYTPSQVLALTERAHIYLSPHHAEAFGLVLVDALTMGLVGIATRYSGNIDYMDASSSFLIDAEVRTIEVRDRDTFRTSDMQWAYPDERQLQDAMVAAYEAVESGKHVALTQRAMSLARSFNAARLRSALQQDE
jgi:glycosyltransferase involved in cell wall biosynthesis